MFGHRLRLMLFEFAGKFAVMENLSAVLSLISVVLESSVNPIYITEYPVELTPLRDTFEGLFKRIFLSIS